MESHTMASENAEEQFSQAKPTLRDRNTVEDCEKSSVSFSGLIGRKPKGRSPGPELYLDNCTENDFEQRPVGREEIIRIWKHIEMKNL